MKKINKKILGYIIGLMFLSTSIFAKNDIEVLTLHHFMSSNAPLQKEILIPWAKKIEKDSKGRLKIEIYPSMSMGGKPPELYKQVRNGSADIVWTLPGYTPGVFPRTEVFELPTVHIGNSVATSIAMKENFDLIKDDYKKIKPLLLYVAAGNAIHTVNKKIEKVSDLKGLKLRAPSRTAGWYIEALEAEPVGMPLPALPQALSKNAVDGAFVPFEVFPSYKFHQLTKYSFEGENGERFGTSIFMLLMNQDRFKSLSKDLQKILIDSIDMNMIKKVGKIMMEVEEPGKKMQNASTDGKVIRLTSKQMEEFNKIGETVVTRWIKEVSKKGIDGQKLVDSARESIKRHSNNLN